MISITDIAKKIGVNPSTVSRALNGKKGVSEKTRDKILKLCSESGYEPNDMARGLISGHSGLVGLIIPDMQSPYYAAIAKGVSDGLSKYGMSMLLCVSGRDVEKEKDCVSLLKRHQVEGIVLVSVTADEALCSSITDAGVKLFTADNVLGKDCTSVINDNYRGALELFRHMASQGCGRLGWIGGMSSAFTTRERMRALKEIASEGHLQFDERDVIYGASTAQCGYEHASELIKRGVDAIFGINDTVALGVMKYCFDNGIRVPHDLKIAGYDDLEVAGMLSVPLTTVHQYKIRLGLKAAELIVSAIRDPVVNIRAVLDPWLVKRESCGEKLSLN